jgi:hypothetical protein
MNESLEFFRKVSYFTAPISNVKSLKAISTRELHGLISSDFLKKWDDLVKVGKASKARVLPYVTWSAICSRRHLNYLQLYTGFICIDLDKVNIVLKALLASDTFLNPVMIFISPSGNGLKLILHVNGATRENHLAHFNAICHYLYVTYGIEADRSGSDICRACFLARDPKCYFNEEGSIDSESLLEILPGDVACNVSTPTGTAKLLVSKDPHISNSEARPSDELNRHVLVHARAEQALYHEGWQWDPRNPDLLTRPGKNLKEGCSAKYNINPADGLWYLTCFSSNGGKIKRKGYTDVQLICELEYNGNWQQTITELAQQYLP